MSLVAQLKELAFAEEDDPRTVMARLLMAAQDDKGLRKQLLFLLRAPSLHRASLVNTAVYEMQMQGEPKNVWVAFGALATNEGAAAALKVLREQ